MTILGDDSLPIDHSHSGKTLHSTPQAGSKPCNYGRLGLAPANQSGSSNMQQAAAPKVSFVSLGCPRDNECKLFEPPTPKEKCRPKAAFIWTINSSIGACPHVRNPSLAGRAPARTLTQKGGMIYVRLCVSAACCYLGQACSILDAGRRSMTTEGSEQVGVVTRPRSAVWYERLAWTALAVGLASAAANPAALAKYYHQYHGGNSILMGGTQSGHQIMFLVGGRRRRKLR